MAGALISVGVGVLLALLLAFTGTALATGVTPEPITAPLVVYGTN